MGGEREEGGGRILRDESGMKINLFSVVGVI